MEKTTMVTVHVDLYMSLQLANDIEREAIKRRQSIDETLTLMLAEAWDARQRDEFEQAAADHLNGHGPALTTVLPPVE